MSFATSHRFSITALAIAVTMTMGLNGLVLKGFDQLASAGERSRTGAAHVAKAQAATPTLTLERVTISARRA